MQNTLMDLNNHLFAELERLGDEDLQGEELIQEIDRAKAIKEVAAQVIANASITLKAAELKYECEGKSFEMPKLLGE